MGERWRKNAAIEIFIAAMLSEAAYREGEKALGWADVPMDRRLDSETEEQARQLLSQGSQLPSPLRESIFLAFWPEDMESCARKELAESAICEASRDRLARRLWVALFAKPYLPEGLRASLENKADGEKSLELSIQREGVLSGGDLHATILAEVWDPESGFNGQVIWAASRGSEIKSLARERRFLEMAKEYAGNWYLDFPKSWEVTRKSAHAALSMAFGEMPEEARPSEIVHVGHSFGGAMAAEAVLQGAELMEASGVRARAITFGSPGSGSVGVVAVRDAAIGLLEKATMATGSALAKTSQALPQGRLENFLFLAGLKLKNPALTPFVEKLRGKLGANEPNATPTVPLLAEQARRVLHLAHRGDVVRSLGESGGYAFPGETIWMEPAGETHAASGYAKSAERLIDNSGARAHPLRVALQECRNTIDSLLKEMFDLPATAPIDEINLPRFRALSKESSPGGRPVLRHKPGLPGKE